MKVKKREILFYLSYICFFVSLFLGDVYETSIILVVQRLLRIAAYGIIVLQIFGSKLKSKEWIKLLLLLIITLVFGIYTRDLYWSILIIFIYASKNINLENILSIIILFSAMICVLCACSVGLLPDVLTARNSSSLDNFVRHSFGFYHSNVLPLIVLYLELYYVLLEKEKAKSSVILVGVGIHVVLFIFCNSRNAFLLAVLFSVLIFGEKYIGTNRKIKKVFYLITKYMVPFLSIFSFSMLFLLLRGGIWDVVDSAFSGRFRLGIYKMRRIGIHLINIMSNEEFKSDYVMHANGTMLDTVVLDNGYLYIILRYGILLILFYFLVSFILSKKAKGNMYVLIVLLSVFAMNFIDNDLVDYLFLPFILIAFNNSQLLEEVDSGNRKRSVKWGISWKKLV